MTSDGDAGGPANEFKGELIYAFIRLARGDFAVRVARNYTRDTDDVLAYFVNLIAGYAPGYRCSAQEVRPPRSAAANHTPDGRHARVPHCVRGKLRGLGLADLRRIRGCGRARPVPAWSGSWARTS